MTAVIVDENDLEFIKQEFSKVAKQFTSADEIKSKSKHFRRIRNRLDYF